MEHNRPPRPAVGPGGQKPTPAGTGYGRVLLGHLDHLPPLESSIIRVFLSSTFTDYATERNLLTKDAVPRLRQYCQTKGLDFQIADMRWGVRDDAQVDHQTTEMCLQEVYNCQKLSHGPCFVAFLGDKYGYCPYPNVIEAKEFELLRKAACTVAKDTTLLSQWYKKDENIVPPSYVLQPITAHFPYYNDQSEGNKEKREHDRDQWQAVDSLLTSLFRVAANKAGKRGSLSAARRHKYFNSVTEEEVAEGILTYSHAAQRTLCFQRTLLNINHLDKLAGRFIDLDGGLPDQEAAGLLKDLKSIKVLQVLGKSNVCEYAIPWAVGGVDPALPEHAEYLERFNEEFHDRVKEQIELSLDGRYSVDGDRGVFQEVLHHAHFCARESSSFCGRQDQLSVIKKKLFVVHGMQQNADELQTNGDDKLTEEFKGKVKVETQNPDAKSDGQDGEDLDEQIAVKSQVAFAREEEEISFEEEKQKVLEVEDLTTDHLKPLVIHGASGSGKTALMAKVAKEAPNWFAKKGLEVVRIVRFLGTSPQTSSIRWTLIGICQQLWDVYDGGLKRLPLSDLEKDFSFLVLYFAALLRRVDTRERSLLILLDSVDQLSADDYAYSMNWLPSVLPPGVHIVLSVLSDHHGCLENLRRVVSDGEQFVELSVLPKETASEMLELWFKGSGRQITGEQRDHVLEAFKLCPQPLFLETSLEQAVRWQSYAPQADWLLGPSTRAAVELIFGRLERDHGQVLVKQALGYLSASKQGLTDAEMEDLLSLCDEVLQDTYLYHLPPNDDLIHLPPLLWRRIHHDLRRYLVERQADGKQVVTWYHRQFAESARNRYAKSDARTELHSHAADYFLGKWSDAEKPLKLTKKKFGYYPTAKRGVAAQPVVYSVNVYNLRKLSELPYQLVHAGRFREFLDEVAANFNFLHAKCRNTLSAVEVLADLKLALTTLDETIALASRESQWGKKTKFKPSNEALNDLEKSNATTPTYITDLNDEEKLIENLRKQDPTEESTVETPDAPCAHQEVRGQLQGIQDLLLLASDAVSRDPNNLAIQVIGQLGPEAGTLPASPSLERLRQGAMAWIQDTSSPLLVPRTQCLPVGGGELSKSIDLSLAFPGDAPENEQKLAVSEDGKVLYAVERRRRNGDLLKKFDLENSAAVVLQQPLKGMDVQFMQLMGDDRYMMLTAYTVRDKYNPVCRTVLIDQWNQRPVTLPDKATVRAVSQDGLYCLLTDCPEEEPSIKVSKKESKKKLLVQIATLLDLAAKTTVPLKAPVEDSSKAAAVSDAVFSPDGTLVVVGCQSQQLVYSTVRGKLKHCFGASSSSGGFFSRSSGSLSCCRVLPSNLLLCPGDNYDDEKSLYVKNLNTGQTVHKLDGHSYRIGIILPSGNNNNNNNNNNNKMVATATTEDVIINGNTKKFIHVWDVESGSLASLCRDEGPYGSLCFAGADGDEYLLSCTKRSSMVHVWCLATSALVHRLVGHNDCIVYSRVACGGLTLVTGSLDNSVKLWAMDEVLRRCHLRKQNTGPALADGEGTTKAPNKRGEGPMVTTAMTVSRDSRVAAVGTDDGWLIFYDLITMETKCHHQVAAGVRALLTSQSGEYFVSASDTVQVWDPSTGQLVRTLENKVTSSPVACLSESCDLVVAGYAGMECHGLLWNLSTGEYLKALNGLYGFGQAVISADASMVVTTMFDFPMVFDVRTGEPKNFCAQPDTMMYGCTCLRISPDGRLVATCSSDGSLRVMDILTGEYLFRMQHKSSVVEATFTSDSRRLITAGFKNILIWSMADGKLLHTLCRHQDFITRLTLAAGDRFLVSCAKDKQVIVWDLTTLSSVAHFHAHCPLKDVAVADDLSAVLFCPQNVAYVGVLRPNPVLRDVVDGRARSDVSDSLQHAQAFALAFSSQKVTQKSSAACSIL